MKSCQDIEIYNSLVRKINEIIGELSTLNNHKLEVQRIVNKCIELKQQIENESYQTLEKINSFNNNILNYTELLEILNTEANNLRQTVELEGNHLFVENSKEGLLEINNIQGNTLWVDNDTEEVLTEFDTSKILRIQSCFEDKVVTQEMVDSGKELAENLGKYKVDYKVTGKNKFITEDWNVTANGLTVTIEDGVFTVNGTNTNFLRYKVTNGNVASIEAMDSWCHEVIDYIEIGKTYSISSKEIGGINNIPSGEKVLISIRDSNKQTIGNSTNKPTVRIDRTPCYIHFYIPPGTYDNYKIAFNIEEGEVVTAYEPYKEQVKTYYLNSPLLEGDTIEQQGDKLVHVHRSEITAYTEGDEFSYITDLTNTLKTKSSPTTEIIGENILKVNKSFYRMSIDFDSVIPVEKSSITYTGNDISLNSTDEITRNDEEVL